MRVEPLKLLRQPGQGFVHDPPDGPQRMPGRDPSLQVNIAEQIAAPLVAASHRFILQASAPQRESSHAVDGEEFFSSLLVGDDELAAIADNVLPPGRGLLGWAQLSVVEAESRAGPVVADPTLDNPYHAIVARSLSMGDEERIAEARQQAHSLAVASTFRGWSQWPGGSRG